MPKKQDPEEVIPGEDRSEAGVGSVEPEDPPVEVVKPAVELAPEDIASRRREHERRVNLSRGGK